MGVFVLVCCLVLDESWGILGGLAFDDVVVVGVGHWGVGGVGDFCALYIAEEDCVGFSFDCFSELAGDVGYGAGDDGEKVPDLRDLFEFVVVPAALETEAAYDARVTRMIIFRYLN